MHDVFISYSTADYTKADHVRQVLETNGIRCWFAPSDMRGSQDFAEEIPKAIKACGVFVLILSKSAQESPWVRREVDAAVDSGRMIFPFALEEFAMDDKFNFLISHRQRYMAYLQEENALGKLVRDLRAVLEKDEPAEPKQQERPAVRKQKRLWLWAVLAAVVVVAAAVLCLVLLPGDGMESGSYVIWNPASGKALTGQVINKHYLAGENVVQQSGELNGYARSMVWQVEFLEDGTLTLSRDGQTMGMEPGYNGIGLGGDYTADLWILEDAGDGLFYIKNVTQETYLEWYEEKNNWSTYDAINSGNRELFRLCLDSAE